MHSGPENFKKVQTKKNLSNQINQFHELFLTKSILCNFKNGQKLIFELAKSLKVLKIQFPEKNYLISQFFFCLDFLKFSGWLWYRTQKYCKNVQTWKVDLFIFSIGPFRKKWPQINFFFQYRKYLYINTIKYVMIV